MLSTDFEASRFASVANLGVERLRTSCVLLAGLGNIGSFLAILLAPLVACIRLVDRDVVELHNTANQFYEPQHERASKVDVTADRIARLAPDLRVERYMADLEDLPWGVFADVDIALAGLDSLRARQVLSEKLHPLQIPYIDGSVGDPALARVQGLLPGQACLECGWSAAHYRQLSTEYPCGQRSVTSPRTAALGCAGAATASLMVAQCVRLLGDCPPLESYEITGDLTAGRVVTSRRRRNERCRFRHEVASRVIRLDTPFTHATFADIDAAVQREFGQQSLQLEFRRGVLEANLFGAGRLSTLAQLRHLRDRRLDSVGLTPRDRVVVRASKGELAAHLCFDATPGTLL
jgi:molybdopterin/thiamine biosynthesis adenylyltransferase